MLLCSGLWRFSGFELAFALVLWALHFTASLVSGWLFLISDHDHTYPAPSLAPSFFLVSSFVPHPHALPPEYTPPTPYCVVCRSLLPSHFRYFRSFFSIHPPSHHYCLDPDYIYFSYPPHPLHDFPSASDSVPSFSFYIRRLFCIHISTAISPPTHNPLITISTTSHLRPIDIFFLLPPSLASIKYEH